MKIRSSVSHFLYLAFLYFLVHVGEIKNRALTTLQHLCVADAFLSYATKKAGATSEMHCGLVDRLQEWQGDSWFPAVLQVGSDDFYHHLKSQICASAK